MKFLSCSIEFLFFSVQLFSFPTWFLSFSIQSLSFCFKVVSFSTYRFGYQFFINFSSLFSQTSQGPSHQNFSSIFHQFFSNFFPIFSNFFQWPKKNWEKIGKIEKKMYQFYINFLSFFFNFWKKKNDKKLVAQKSPKLIKNW